LKRRDFGEEVVPVWLNSLLRYSPAVKLHGQSKKGMYPHCKKSWMDFTYVRLPEFQCCNLHTNNPLLDLVLQLCNNPLQN